MDIQFVDYDNVRFHLSTPTSKTQVLLSMAIQCWPDLIRYGAWEQLQSEYGEWLQPESQTEPEYNVSLIIDLEKIPPGQGKLHSHVKSSSSKHERGPMSGCDQE